MMATPTGQAIKDPFAADDPEHIETPQCIQRNQACRYFDVMWLPAHVSLTKCELVNKGGNTGYKYMHPLCS